MFPAGDRTYYGSVACSTVCDPPSSEAGAGLDAGLGAFNHITCTIRGSTIECRFEVVCGG